MLPFIGMFSIYFDEGLITNPRVTSQPLMNLMVGTLFRHLTQSCGVATSRYNRRYVIYFIIRLHFVISIYPDEYSNLSNNLSISSIQIIKISH